MAGRQARKPDPVGHDSVMLEGLQWLMGSMARRSKSKVVMRKKAKATIIAISLRNSPHRFVFFRDEGYKKLISLKILAQKESIDLSDFKFKGLKKLSFACVSNKKTARKRGFYFKTNGSNIGFGKGGMFALIDSTLDLGEASFEIVWPLRERVELCGVDSFHTRLQIPAPRSPCEATSDRRAVGSRAGHRAWLEGP